MTEEYYSEDSFKNQLDVEGLLLMHMNRIAMYRDTDIKRYCSGVETLILLCPRNIREKVFQFMDEQKMIRGKYDAVTEERLVIYDDLHIFINEQLEKNHMIWKTRSVKTYQ
jgi:hypothetical protein